MASAFDRWLSSVNRTTFAVAVIAGAVVLMIILNPPKTICDTQLDQIRDTQKGFLFDPGGDAKARKLMSYGRMVNYCKANNSPGACYELFSRMKSVATDLAAVSAECSSVVGDAEEIRRAVWGTLGLLIRLAWGEKPPEAPVDKMGWLDVADLSLFCKLKAMAIRIYGESDWAEFQESLFKELPGAASLSRNDAWARMITSEDCGKYP